METWKIILSAAVPLLIEEFKAMGGPSGAELYWARETAPDVIASYADRIIENRRGTSNPSPREVFNAIARALAIMAFLPSGVVFAGTHWLACVPGCTVPLCCELQEEAPALS